MRFLIPVLLLLSGCAALGTILDAIPPPTPQEECQSGGGHWRDVTIYDANGNPTDSGECISGGDHDWSPPAVINNTPIVVPERPPVVVTVNHPPPASHPSKDKARANTALIGEPFSDGQAGAGDPEVECSDDSIFDCARVYS